MFRRYAERLLYAESVPVPVGERHPSQARHLLEVRSCSKLPDHTVLLVLLRNSSCGSSADKLHKYSLLQPSIKSVDCAAENAAVFVSYVR